MNSRTACFICLLMMPFALFGCNQSKQAEEIDFSTVSESVKTASSKPDGLESIQSSSMKENLIGASEPSSVSESLPDLSSAPAESSDNTEIVSESATVPVSAPTPPKSPKVADVAAENARAFLDYVDLNIDRSKVGEIYFDAEKKEVVIWVLDQDYVNRFVLGYTGPPVSFTFMDKDKQFRTEENYDRAAALTDYLIETCDPKKTGCYFMNNRNYSVVIWVTDQAYTDSVIAEYTGELPTIEYKLGDISLAELEKIRSEILTLPSVKKHKDQVFNIYVDDHENYVLVKMRTDAPEINKEIESRKYGTAVLVRVDGDEIPNL